MYTMNRCFSFTGRLLAPVLLALTLVLLLTTPDAQAQAQAPTPVQPLPVRVLPIPATATLGVLQVMGWPEAVLNGQPARMAPGSRIRDPGNLIVPPASIIGQPLQVLYVLDSQGMVREAWMLSADELAALIPPSPAINSP
jgi:hypothetical protein